jgi:branched-chain amino acid transport system permease protein
VLFAYVVYWCFVKANIDPYLCLLIVVPLAFVVGLGLFYLLFRKAAANDDKNVSLLLAVGLMYLIDNVVLRVWTANPRGLKLSYANVNIGFLGLRVSMVRLILLGLALVSALVVHWFLKRTRLGTAVRAASEDMEATTLQGINSVWVCAISFAVGIALAGAAGVGMASVYSFDYKFGFTFALKALVALALGGLGNVFGALAGGILLGIFENLAAYYVGISWIEVVSYGVFMLVLTFLPQGLFGKRGLVKKV